MPFFGFSDVFAGMCLPLQLTPSSSFLYYRPAQILEMAQLLVFFLPSVNNKSNRALFEQTAFPRQNLRKSIKRRIFLPDSTALQYFLALCRNSDSWMLA